MKVHPGFGGRVYPFVRKTTPLRLVVDLAAQPDYAELSRRIEANGPSRAERKQRVWDALAGLAAVQEPFLSWLRQQGGVSDVAVHRSLNRVAFTGPKTLVRPLAERDDVLAVWGRLPERRPQVPSRMERHWPDPPDDWALEALRAPEAWAEGYQGQGTVVAILDSGVAPDHPALSARRDAAGIMPGGQDVDPSGGHGLAVLGCAVGDGRVGVAPAARWAAADPFHVSSLEPDRVAAVLDWLLGTARPDVVVMPWEMGDDSENDVMRVFLGALRTAGIVVVVAAGNDGPAPGHNKSPANLAGLAPDGGSALSVGAVDRDLRATEFSERGPSRLGGGLFPQVAAPGLELRVLEDTERGVRRGAGTSEASGYVAGAAAVVLSANPTLSAVEVEDVLKRTARDLGEPGPDTVHGFGLVDVAAAARRAAERGDGGRR